MYAFVRPGDDAAASFACGTRRHVGGWVGQAPPEPLDAAILFAPVGALVPEALSRVRPGGVVVCAGIHMSDIPAFPYRLLWERTRRALSREPHARRRPGFPRHRSQRLHPDADAHVPPRASQRRARRFARRPSEWRRRVVPLSRAKNPAEIRFFSHSAVRSAPRRERYLAHVRFPPTGPAAHRLPFDDSCARDQRRQPYGTPCGEEAL